MANENAAAEKDEDLAPRIAAVEQRITAVETLLATKVPGFETVGARVTELSGAFLQANQRLTALEAGLEALQVTAPAPAEERLAAVEAGLSTLLERVDALAAVRARSGLSGRLAGIEEKLDQLLPPGGTQ